MKRLILLSVFPRRQRTSQCIPSWLAFLRPISTSSSNVPTSSANRCPTTEPAQTLAIAANPIHVNLQPTQVMQHSTCFSLATLALLLPSIRLTTNKRNGQPSVDWRSPQILLQQTNSSSTNLQNSHVLAQPLRRPPAYVSCREANQHTGQNRSSLPVKERLPPDTMLNI